MDFLSIHDIRFPSIHVKGLPAIPSLSVQASKVPLFSSMSSSSGKKSPFSRLLRQISEVDCEVIDIFIDSGSLSVRALYIDPSGLQKASDEHVRSLQRMISHSLDVSTRKATLSFKATYQAHWEEGSTCS